MYKDFTDADFYEIPEVNFYKAVEELELLKEVEGVETFYGWENVPDGYKTFTQLAKMDLIPANRYLPDAKVFGYVIGKGYDFFDLYSLKKAIKKKEVGTTGLPPTSENMAIALYTINTFIRKLTELKQKVIKKAIQAGDFDVIGSIHTNREIKIKEAQGTLIRYMRKPTVPEALPTKEASFELMKNLIDRGLTSYWELKNAGVRHCTIINHRKIYLKKQMAMAQEQKIMGN